MAQKYKVLAIIGASGSGKDTILRAVLNNADLSKDLHKILMTTTRPKRDGEEEGKEYHFISNEQFADLVASGSMVEASCFSTGQGEWFYGSNIEDYVLDKINIGIFDPARLDILMADTNFEVVPLEIQATAKNRLIRQLSREEEPDIEEIIRRYKTDLEDFSNLVDDYGNLYVLSNNDNITLDYCISAFKWVLDKMK